MPIFGQLTLFLGLIGERDVGFVHILLSKVTTLIAAALVFMLATRLFSRERMVFGT